MYVISAEIEATENTLLQFHSHYHPVKSSMGAFIIDISRHLLFYCLFLVTCKCVMHHLLLVVKDHLE